DTNIYLSGHFSLAQCDSTITICTNCDKVMRFDGTYGRIMGIGLNTNANAIAVVGTNVYFAGPFTNAGGITVNRMARWDGSVWSGVGGGIVGNGTINALAVIGTNLYAGGTFTNMGGVPANHLAKWDGGAWSALGSGTTFSGSSGPVLALATVGSDLYVGGTFRTAGGKPANFLARWNESVHFDLAPLQLSQWSANPGSPFLFTLSAHVELAYIIDAT